jgi:hypothetical protein
VPPTATRARIRHAGAARAGGFAAACEQKAAQCAPEKFATIPRVKCLTF